ncbi:hypothetical protein N7474_000986 [Penicillium riverlandense]|uniref:uncharacterized protein n=1 Tax=Penicillium riverlandense TaxID=1903569 RepID=UPI0025487188|nr:uncharacterized protein N7474_000986 [Penicillium riverlandense]KAJ5832675.1 hypothetical protein N7474_000986 [Penicillium riverlandense]
MPTPSNNQPTAPPSIAPVISARTCPPELDRISARRDSPDSTLSSDTIDNVLSPESIAAPSVLSRSDDGSSLLATDPLKVDRKMSADDETGPGRSSSPTESSCARGQSSVTPANSSLLRYEFSNVRLLPNHTSSFLRSGSKFVGTQQSDRQVYNVDVEIKHVDMAESYLCGYLRIQGLTEDHPTLTTFFEGEIIGTKHTFQTRNEAWGATEKTDMHHWSRFAAWRPLAKQAKRTDFTYRNFAQREHVFMRWKEYFLVPDHRVRTISGASFEGFYYICFNQVAGTVSGVYFHAKSERFQQLELKHVEDRGCAPAVEFR